MDEYLKGITSRAKRKLTKADEEAITAAGRQQLVYDLQEIESRAHHFGMHVTAHALNRAKNALGWEMAGDVEKAAKASRNERPI